MISISFGGITLTEPATAITNLGIVLLCFFIVWKINSKGSSDLIVRNWKRYFLFNGISNIIAIVVHGLQTYVYDENHIAVWVLMNLVAEIGVYFALLATVRTFVIEENQRKYQLISLGFMLLSFVVFVIYLKFVITMVALIIGLGTIMTLNIKEYKRGSAVSGRIAFGLSILIFAAIVNAAKINIHPWFEFNALAHLFIGASFILVYRGVALQVEQTI